jgi:hypothetical protein
MTLPTYLKPETLTSFVVTGSFIDLGQNLMLLDAIHSQLLLLLFTIDTIEYPSINSKFGWSTKSFKLCLCPVAKLSRQITLFPFDKNIHKLDPIKPAPPVINIVFCVSISIIICTLFKRFPPFYTSFFSF